MEDVMKKALFLLLTLGFCFAGIANPPVDSWIISKEGKMNCKQTAQINSYSLDGKLFNKLNLYIDGKVTNRMVFMELVKTRGGSSLYKYYRFDVDQPHYCYYIYNGNQFCYALDGSMDSKKLKNLFRYFGLRAVLA
jgi:hypothetical protein